MITRTIQKKMLAPGASAQCQAHDCKRRATQWRLLQMNWRNVENPSVLNVLDVDLFTCTKHSPKWRKNAEHKKISAS